MNPDFDIIYYTLFPWENAYSSVSLSFTREFCKTNRVFYINPPYSWKDVAKMRNHPVIKKRLRDYARGKTRYERIEELPDNVIAVAPPPTIPINWLPQGNLYNEFSAYNHRVVLKTVKKVVQDYQLKNFIYFNCFNPFHGALLPENFGQKLNIYQCIDDMTQEVYTAKHGVRLENEAIKDSDLALVTSTNLHRLKSPFNPNTHIVHNAVDISIFREALEKKLPRPKELKGITGKIIGFTGNLDQSRIDYRLLREIALAHPKKTLVLVGPLNNTGYKTFELDKLPNVILTGGKHIRELPAYLQYFDVAIIPFLLNKLTESIYPLKINEYLAAGKAVVSTNFSNDIRGFAKDIYLAENEKTFLNLIDRAIAENSETKITQRAATADSNTWTERVKQFWDIVNAHLAVKTTL